MVEIIPTCRFFDPRAGECHFKGAAVRALLPYQQRAQRAFNAHADTGDLILRLDQLMRTVPSMGEYPSQKAYMDGFVRCGASRDQGNGEYSPDIESQRTCDCYVSPEETSEEGFSRIAELPPGKSLMLPPG